MESPFKADILKGKVALLTGGGSGIGYEISYQLGKHGASIVIMGRRRNVLDSAVDSLRSHGIHVIYFLLLPRILFFFFFQLVWNSVFVNWVCLVHIFEFLFLFCVWNES